MRALVRVGARQSAVAGLLVDVVADAHALQFPGMEAAHEAAVAAVRIFGTCAVFGSANA